MSSRVVALAKERGLRGYSKLKKAELIAFIQDDLRPPLTPAPRTRPPRPTRPPPPQLFRFRPDRPKQPTSQEMDMFEQQEMRKSRSQVTIKLMIGTIG